MNKLMKEFVEMLGCTYVERHQDGCINLQGGVGRTELDKLGFKYMDFKFNLYGVHIYNVSSKVKGAHIMADWMGTLIEFCIKHGIHVIEIEDSNFEPRHLQFTRVRSIIRKGSHIIMTL